MSQNRPTKPAFSRAIRPVIENLEGRQLLSAVLTGGTLAVTGTTGNDVITISLDTHKAATVDATVNGKTSQFATSSVKMISIDAGAGNDKVTEASNVMVKTAEQGSGGNDSLVAGGGSDSLSGGTGNDSIHGGAGNDYLNGGSGNDTVQAGPGHDTLLGGGGDDKITGASGNDVVETPPTSGVPLNTLPQPVQTGLLALAQGASIGNVTPFQDGGRTLYGTVVTISGVNTRIVVDGTGKAISDSPADGSGAPVVQNNTTFGTVVSVDTINNLLTISVSHEGGSPTQSTFTVPSSIKITKADVPVTLASLVAGTLVHVQSTSAAPTVATSIWVVVPEVKTSASGPLVAVDTIGKTITLGGDAGKTTIYPLDPSATFTLNGVASSLGALPIGASISLKLASDGITVLAVTATAANKTVTGPLLSVDTAADTITLGGDAGKTTTYPLDPSATIKLNDAASTLGALPVGASVTLKLALDGTTALTVTASAQNKTVSGPLVSVDTVGNMITLGGEAGKTTAYPLDPGATIKLNDVSSTLGALPLGASVTLKLALDGKTALTVSASAQSKTVSGPLISVDTVGNTVTLGGDAGKTTTYPLDPSATIKLNDAASTLGALPVGASVTLKLALDGKTALTVTASAQNKTVTGPLVSVDTVGKTITLGGDAGKMTVYPLDPSATIMLNGTGTTLGALPVGASVTIKLALDGTTALTVTATAQHKVVTGSLISVDSANGKITIGGDTPTTYVLDPSATVVFNGAPGTLGALPVGAHVELTLSFVGSTVIAIAASKSA